MIKAIGFKGASIMLLCLTTSLNLIGQVSPNDYKIFSAVIQSFRHPVKQEKYLVEDSTMAYTIDLTGLKSILKNSKGTSLDLAASQFAYGELLREVWNDTTLYSLLVEHNHVNNAPRTIENRFDANLKVQVLSSDIDQWEEISKRYPDNNGVLTFSRPGIVLNRAIVITQIAWGGNAGEVDLITLEKIAGNWVTKKLITLGGD